LAGGTGARLGGADKARIELGGRTLLARALLAVAEAEEIVVVGPTVVLDPPNPAVAFVTESPPGGGPAAGLLAGRDALSGPSTVLVVLAVDMPGVTAATIARIRDALTEADGVFLTGSDGRRQLAGLVRISALDAVRPTADAVDGLPMHRLLDRLQLTLLPSIAQESTDIDTWGDLNKHSGKTSGDDEGAC
jgi:molybdopterin-guanine dinucleotide biosynthesis protein A